MCGIAGYYAPKSVLPREADIDSMLNIMGHRGPDGDGHFESDDKRYQAGFVRLSIIDLETGDQPIIDHDAGRVLTSNGEIYNYVELRQQPDLRDYPYQTQGDAESILALARKYGNRFVDHLNGMFGLALYEKSPHRLYLVRDRLGIKPVYWVETAEGGILYASEIKALFASGLVKPEIDETAVSAYLSHGYVPAPLTLYRGVNKLPPGHILTAENGNIAVESYWRARSSDHKFDSLEEAEEAIVELLKDSIRLQLRSDVPVGALLSGGLDSGLIVALASAQTSHALNTYTICFEGAPVDETPLAAAVAQRYGTQHTEMNLPASSITKELPRLLWYCDEPLNDPALLPNMLIESELKKHVKVAFNGTGGDEIFGGYMRYFRSGIENRYLKWPRWFRSSLFEPLVSQVSPMTAWRFSRAEKFDHDRGQYLHDHTTQFPPPIRRVIGNSLPMPAIAQKQYFDASEEAPETAALCADINTYLPEDLLTLLDRTSMAHSVEGRVPFLDHRLVEAALAVPPHIRTGDGQQKAFERKIAKPYLPDQLLNAPKRGFASPVPAWMKTDFSPLARRILSSKSALNRGWWTKDGIDQLFAKSQQHAFRIYSLLTLELSIRIHTGGQNYTSLPEDGLESFAETG